MQLAVDVLAKYGLLVASAMKWLCKWRQHLIHVNDQNLFSSSSILRPREDAPALRAFERRRRKHRETLKNAFALGSTKRATIC
jgi:hypothetical protein